MKDAPLWVWCTSYVPSSECSALPPAIMDRYRGRFVCAEAESWKGSKKGRCSSRLDASGERVASSRETRHGTSRTRKPIQTGCLWTQNYLWLHTSQQTGFIREGERYYWWVVSVRPSMGIDWLCCQLYVSLEYVITTFMHMLFRSAFVQIKLHQMILIIIMCGMLYPPKCLKTHRVSSMVNCGFSWSFLSESHL